MQMIQAFPVPRNLYLRRLDSNDSNSFPLFQINGDEIESTGNIKYLGVQIDPSLNWKEKINVAIGKI